MPGHQLDSAVGSIDLVAYLVSTRGSERIMAVGADGEIVWQRDLEGSARLVSAFGDILVVDIYNNPKYEDFCAGCIFATGW
ncbi:MAG: hypothetical protein ACK5H2_04420 [Beutenbergiaceae bacterium]